MASLRLPAGMGMRSSVCVLLVLTSAWLLLLVKRSTMITLTRPSQIVFQLAFSTTYLQMCIRPGTFAFLVQGEGMPSRSWVDFSQVPNPGNSTRAIIWLSWKTEALRNALPPTLQNVLFLPKSTFNVGRNTLWRKAQETEVKQGWCFEYLVFMDEDVGDSLAILPGNVRDFDSVPIPNLELDKRARLAMPVKAIVLLQHLVLTFRPARAGVLKYHWPMTEILPNSGGCRRNCYMVSW